MKHGHTVSSLLVVASLLCGHAARGDEPYVSEVRLFAFDFCPAGWLEADGRVLPVAEYMELFATWGNSYGGDGRLTLALPDLRGRVPLGVGEGPGLSSNRQGRRGGSESVMLNTRWLPQHNHAVTGNEGPGNSNVTLATGTEDESEALDQPVRQSGEARLHENRPPYLAMRYCVAVRGYFPTRY